MATVKRVEPSALIPGDRIAIPSHNQNLADLKDGQSVKQTAVIEKVYGPMPGCRNFHVWTRGSSIPGCWDRAGTVPLAN